MSRVCSKRPSTRFLKQFAFETFEPRRLLAGIQISESVDRTIVNDNGMNFDYYDVSLESQPIADVIIQILTSDPLVQVNSLQLDPTQVVFTPDDWSPKRVLVSALDRSQLTTGAMSVQISHQVSTLDPSYQDTGARNVAVTVIDTDSQIALTWYDQELLEGELQFTFFDVLFPPGYSGPRFTVSYDTTQIFLSGVGPGTLTISAFNDGIEEGVQDVPLDFIPDGQIPPGYAAPQAIVRVTDATTPELTGFQISRGQVQRSIVNSLKLFFSTEIGVNPSDIVLTSNNSTIPVFMTVGDDRKSLNISYGENFVFERTLPDGNYELFIPPGAITQARSNVPLVQEIRLGAADGLFRLFGDLNGNGTIDELEFDTFNAAFGSSIGSNFYNPDLDEKNDGVIGDDDRASFQKIKLSPSTIAEDASIGTPIGSLSAFSLLGPVTSYEVVAVDGSTIDLPFSVQNNTLILAAGLDFESNRLRRVEVKATTEAGVATFGEVDVQLTNVNENSLSPIQVTNDKVLENDLGLIGNLFIPDSGEEWQFSLSTGAGDYDNALFAIEGDQLSVLESPDYETRDNYSIHVLAQSGTQQVEAAITIDITPVDEFAPETLVFWTEQFGESFTIPYLVENSPVGQPATRIRILDQDRGEVYSFSGFFGDLAEVQGDAFFPIREINFEAIESPFHTQYSVTAVSSNGVTIQGSGDTSTIVDVNDAPIAVLPISDRAYFAGEQNTFSIAPDSFFDEDTWDYLTISASISGGEPLPSWLIFDSLNLEFIANPPLSTNGSFDIEVRATDSQGESVSTTFRLQINPLPTISILGTPGNDLLQLTRLSVPTDSWQVQRNGQTVFTGSLNNFVVSFDGGGGNDRVVVRGSDQANTFDLLEDYFKIEQTRVITDNVEQFDIRGRSGNDLLNVFGLPSGASAANRTMPTSFAFFGDSGQDKVQSVFETTQWTITGNSSGNVNGVLSFASVESLAGGFGDDTFTIESNGFPSIDGDAGNNTFRRVQPGGQAQLEIDSLSPFVGQLNGTELLNLSLIDLGATNGTVTGPAASLVPVVNWYLGEDPNHLLVSAEQSIELFGFSRIIGRDSQDLFSVLGTTGARTIDGGDGSDELLLQLVDSQLNLRNNSATGISSFRDIETFSGSGYSSSIVGPNRETEWTFDNVSVTAAWNHQPGIALVNFGSILGGNGRDTFFLSTEIVDTPFNFPIQISGGGGQDTIETFTDPEFSLNAFWNLLGLGSGIALGVNFDSVEHLVAGTDFDQITFVDASANSQWFDSIRATETSGYTLLRYSGQTGVTVNLQNRTASGVNLWQGIDGIYGSDGADLVIGTNEGSTWTIYLGGEFATDNTHYLQGFETIQGGTGNDTMVIVDVAGDPSRASRLLGGAGVDTLSFAQVPVPVTVSLLAGTVSLFERGIGQFENVIGTVFDDEIEGNNADNILAGLIGNDRISGLGGNDVLLGASGDDTLFGGSGRDLLVGGSGADWLFGGGGEDLLISGQSSAIVDEAGFEDGIRYAALQAIMTEWTSNRNYLQRIARLRSGVGVGNSVALNSTTVQTDDELDRVFGDGDDDWFWVGSEDIDNDRLNRERVN